MCGERGSHDVLGVVIFGDLSLIGPSEAHTAMGTSILDLPDPKPVDFWWTFAAYASAVVVVGAAPTKSEESEAHSIKMHSVNGGRRKNLHNNYCD